MKFVVAVLRRQEPHTFRTHAFISVRIFVWSSSSAANGSRTPTHVRRRRRSRTRWRPYLSTFALLTSLQFDFKDPCYGQLKVVKSRYPLTSIRMTISRAQFGTHRGQVFLEVNNWQVNKFSLDREAQMFSKIIGTSQKTGAPLLGLAKSIYYLCFY